MSPIGWKKLRFVLPVFSTQLEAGLRSFDVRTEQIYDELQVWHGIIDQFNCLDNIFQEMVAFLEKNSGEFIMMRLDDYDDNNEGMITKYPTVK